jgi:hypothetical protein
MSNNEHSNRSLAFQWIPGFGPSEESLARLRKLVPRRPHEAPGAAWFMSETRQTFPKFLTCEVSEIPGTDIDNILFEITSGIRSFFEAREEVEAWTMWFKHLLPDLIIEGDRFSALEYLIEGVITAFFRVYADGIDSEYSGFRHDVLRTIGQSIMRTTLWDDQGESVCARRQGWIAAGDGSVMRPYCSGAISASLFFCLTYLHIDEIDEWTRSLLIIESDYFHAHLLAWLVGAHPILTADSWPLAVLDRAPMEIDWQHSFLLNDRTPRIPAANVEKFFSVVSEDLSLQTLLNWVQDISQIPELYESFYASGIPEYVADSILRPAMT